MLPLRRLRLAVVVLTAAMLLISNPEWVPGTTEPGSIDLNERAFEDPTLDPTQHSVPLEVVLSRLPQQSAWIEFRSAQSASVAVFIDPRSGTPANIIASIPVIPGSGTGNAVTLAELGVQVGMSLTVVTPAVVAESVRRFVLDHIDIFAVEAGQIGPAYAYQVTGDLWQVSIPQEVNGIGVRGARIAATVSHGNLVLIGTSRWGDVAIDTTPDISSAEAQTIGFGYGGGRQAMDTVWKEPVLEVLATTPASRTLAWGPAAPVGGGYAHRLVWAFGFERPPDIARWEVVVDAHTGEVVAFKDTTAHARHIKGGVYPATDTGECVGDPFKCGTMQNGYPMPWADTGLPAPSYANGAGAFDAEGAATTALDGLYVRITEGTGLTCPFVSRSSPSGDLDLEGSNLDHGCEWNNIFCGPDPGTEELICMGGPHDGQPCDVDRDCVDSDMSSASARTTFYELNKMFEIARGWLGNSNPWPNTTGSAKVEAIVNGAPCVGHCDGAWLAPNKIRLCPEDTTPLQRCAAPGELATFITHEWGHGLDDND